MQYPVKKAKRIIQIVQKYYGIKQEDMLGTRRKRNIARARQMAMYFAHHYAKISHSHMGRLMKKDHSTVMHGIDKITELEKKDGNIMYDVESLRALVEPAMQDIGGGDDDEIEDGDILHALEAMHPTSTTVNMQMLNAKAVYSILNHPQAVEYRKNLKGLAENRLKVAKKMAGRVNYAG